MQGFDMSSLLALAGDLHPLLVHLPIGFILIVGLMEASVAWTHVKAGRELIGFALACSVFAAFAAVVAGLLLAGDHESDLLFWHRSLGIATFVAAALTWRLHQRIQLSAEKSAVAWYRASLFATVAAVSVAGHLGGSMTRGPDYLTRHFAAPSAPPGPAEVDAGYATVVRPILEEHCFECHDGAKERGGLRLDVRADALRGGESGVPAIVPGEATESELVRRLLLPATHKKAMPERGERLSPESVLTLVEWINSGARFASRPPAENAALERLRSKGVSVEVVSRLGDELRADVSVACESLDEELIDALAEISHRLVWLSVAGCDIDALELARLGELPLLASLNLARTEAGSETLAWVAGHSSLRRLNLHSTPVDDSALDALCGIEGLERVYVWQTQVSERRIRDPEGCSNFEIVGSLTRDEPDSNAESTDEGKEPPRAEP
jgi:uncharacterized membrane protein